MAGSASVAASWRDPAATFAANTTAVENLLDEIAQRERAPHLVCVSSAEVYGEPSPDKLPFSEELEPDPVSPYGESKAAMEALCARYERSHGLRIAVIRNFNMLGPGQSEEFVASGFARQIAAAEAEGRSSIALAVGNLAVARDFTDVRDAARAYAALAAAELTGTFNLCSGEAVPLESLIELIRGATEIEVSVEPRADLVRPADPATVVGSPQRLHEAIGWERRIPLAQTVDDLLDWWRGRLAASPAA